MKRRVLSVMLVLAVVVAASLAVTQLARGGHLPDDREKMPPEKRALFEAAEREMIEGQKLPQPTSSNPLGILRPTSTPRPLKPGFREQPQPMNGYMFENVWLDVVNDVEYQLYAGWVKYEPMRGIILLITNPEEDRSSATAEVFEAPAGVGALRIISRDGMKFALVASAGQTYIFDVEARKLTEVPAAEITASPLGTPVPMPTAE